MNFRRSNQDAAGPFGVIILFSIQPSHLTLCTHVIFHLLRRIRVSEVDDADWNTSSGGGCQSNTDATTVKLVTGNARTVSRASKFVEGLTSIYSSKASSQASSKAGAYTEA